MPSWCWARPTYTITKVCVHGWFRLMVTVKVHVAAQSPKSVCRSVFFGGRGGWVSVQWCVSIRYSCMCIQTENIPLRILSSWQRRKSQMRTVPSSEQVANLLSVGEKLKTEWGRKRINNAGRHSWAPRVYNRVKSKYNLVQYNHLRGHLLGTTATSPIKLCSGI